MKRFIFSWIYVLCACFAVCAQDYYWYQGKKIALERGNQRYIIYEVGLAKDIASLPIIESGVVSDSKNNHIKWGIVNQEDEIVSPGIVYQMSSFFCFNRTQNMFVTHRFYVKLKKSDDILLLQNLVDKYQAEVETEDKSPLWYILKCGKGSQYNALQLANIFYESGLFAVAEPEFMNAVKMDCVNDPRFPYQWNLNNTGQWGNTSGIDINYCDAHTITQGDSSVIIGVYDIGVDLTHPDINFYPFSFDVNSQTSPSTIYTVNNNNYHGTACAGIIGAKTNNNMDVAGIAPNCPIMSLSFHNATAANIKNGFMTAADNGCAVISNSWHYGASSEFINQGISYALSQGRNGAGCVIVFSAGNENRDSVNYPANSNDSIIVVGAMSPCGERCNPYSCEGENWGGNYGNKLDIMAPGVKITTTDNVGSDGIYPTNYMGDFNATSSACPHVAAIAGLILSVNPYLSSKDVADIIESTAQKVGTGFGTEPNRTNGTWSYEYGYGLVDAYAAVLEAQNRCPTIQGANRLCSSEIYQLNAPSTATIRWSYETDIMQVDNYPILIFSDTTSSMVTVQRGTFHFSYHGFVGPEFIYNGDVTLKATITYGGKTKVITKEITLWEDELPTLPSSSLATIGWQETRTFTINNCIDVPNNMLKWIITLPNASSSITRYGAYWTFTPTSPGNLNIKLYNLMNCSLTAHSNYNITVDFRIPDPLLAYQNPVRYGSVDVQIYYNKYYEQCGKECDGEELPVINYTLELWDDNSHSVRKIEGSLSSPKDNIKLDVSGLRSGIYLLTLKMKGQIVTSEKMIIIH